MKRFYLTAEEPLNIEGDLHCIQLEKNNDDQSWYIKKTDDSDESLYLLEEATFFQQIEHDLTKDYVQITTDDKGKVVRALGIFNDLGIEDIQIKAQKLKKIHH